MLNFNGSFKNQLNHMFFDWKCREMNTIRDINVFEISRDLLYSSIVYINQKILMVDLSQSTDKITDMGTDDY